MLKHTRLVLQTRSTHYEQYRQQLQHRCSVRRNFPIGRSVLDDVDSICENILVRPFYPHRHLPRGRSVRIDDVRKQLRRGRATVLVLDHIRMERMVVPQTVRACVRVCVPASLLFHNPHPQFSSQPHPSLALHFTSLSRRAWLNPCIFRPPYRCRRDDGNLIYRFLQSISLLAALRTLWRWNQTGQKRAGSPDIARHSLPRHTSVLWTLVFATYGYVALRLGWRRWSIVGHVSRQVSAVMLTVLVVIALNFKMAFTAADAPELFGGLPTFLSDMVTTQVSLVAQARAVFTGIFIGAVCVIYPRRGPLSQSRIGSFVLTHLLFCIIHVLIPIYRNSHESPRPLDSLPHHTDPHDQHPNLRHFRPRAHDPSIMASISFGALTDLIAPPIRQLLRPGWLQRHLVRRSVKCVQRRVRVQCWRGGGADVRRQLGRTAVVDFGDDAVLADAAAAAAAARTRRGGSSSSSGSDGEIVRPSRGSTDPVRHRKYSERYAGVHSAPNASFHLDSLLPQISVYFGVEYRSPCGRESHFRRIGVLGLVSIEAEEKFGDHAIPISWKVSRKYFFSPNFSSRRKCMNCRV